MIRGWLNVESPSVFTWAKAKNSPVLETTVTGVDIPPTLPLWYNERGADAGLELPRPVIPYLLLCFV